MPLNSILFGHLIILSPYLIEPPVLLPHILSKYRPSCLHEVRQGFLVFPKTGVDITSHAMSVLSIVLVALTVGVLVKEQMLLMAKSLRFLELFS